MSSYFVRTGPSTFRATQLTSGAWSTAELHIAPMYGLVTHVVEQFARSQGSPGLVMSRLVMEILGVIQIAEVDVHVDVIRPGRTIELLEATVTQSGRPVVRARAWFLTPSDTSEVAGGTDAPLPHPNDCPSLEAFRRWPGDFIKSLDGRIVRTPIPGRATVWIGTDVPLIADEPVSDLARFLGLIDTANGIAIRTDPRKWIFPNVDATLQLHRQPSLDGGTTWAGLDTTVIFGASGIGVDTTVLHDTHGEVGRLQQTLTVRRLS